MRYIAHYDTKPNRRGISLAAVNKINYICEALNKNGIDVEVVSAGMDAQDEFSAEREKINSKLEVKYFKTCKIRKNLINKIYRLLRRNIILFSYLIKNIKKDEQIIVYHSLALMRCIYWAKKIKKFKLILETEEIYNDVSSRSKISRRFEEKFISCADKYIFSTELLNAKNNMLSKPYSVIYGTYRVEHDRGVSFNDDKIHVVYAGTFDPRKGGVTAAAAAQWLPQNFHVHILGFGSEREIENIKKVVRDTNEKAQATVTYDGLLSGEEYLQFLQKCQIGLSTQNPDADFNATSFPSKILSYMSNGLRVVTIRIPAIEGAAVGQELYYYDVQTPKEIAKAIMSIDLNDGYDGREKIAKLDEEFTKDLKILLQK